MTRKDYVAMAHVIKDEVDRAKGNLDARDTARRIAFAFVDIARKDNPNFSAAQFLAACGLVP